MEQEARLRGATVLVAVEEGTALPELLGELASGGLLATYAVVSGEAGRTRNVMLHVANHLGDSDRMLPTYNCR